MRVFIDKGEKIKINNITFVNNSALPSAKLRGFLKPKKSFRTFGKVLNILKKTSEDLGESLNDIVDLGSETPEFSAILFLGIATIRQYPHKLEGESNIALGDMLRGK